jgi:hypothetical protein
MSEKLVTCRCQHCDAHIEFDASGFQEGDAATVKCPDCLFVTTISVPASMSQNQPEKKPSAQSFRQFSKSVSSVQTLLTSRFERILFAVIRQFVILWAALMLLVLSFVTLNYVSTFFPSKPDRTGANENSNDLVSRIMESDYLKNFGIYFSAACVLLTMLTFVSIVLVLMAIERNTRKNEKAD